MDMSKNKETNRDKKDKKIVSNILYYTEVIFGNKIDTAVSLASLLPAT